MRAAAGLCGTTHKTVKRVLERRAAGQRPGRRRTSQPGLAEPFTDLIYGKVKATDGRITAKRLLPVAGLMADRAPEVVADQLDAVTSVVRQLGCTVPAPFMAMSFLSLPVILLQAYGFLMPAFDPSQRRRMLPITVAIPVLFAAGVAFGYAVVLPAALHFFQNFNSSEFNVLVQASQYYKFAATTLLAMGLLFQVPVAIIAVTRAGIITPRQLRRNRRYAVLACGLVAATLPGDAITMLLETLPLYVLFEASVLVASLAERRQRAREARETRANQPESDGSGLGL